MANETWTDKDAHAVAHISYALIYVLLDELEKERPGLRKRVWQEAERSLREYDVLDDASLDWVRSKLASL
jgi:hypothetical protein